MEKKEHQRLVQQEFTLQAERFAQNAVLSRDQELQLIVEAARIAPGERVLDVACGTGLLTFAAAHRGAAVTGLDLTEAMLQVARQSLARASQAGRGLAGVTFQRGDAGALPFADRSFDAVITRLSVHHFPDPSLPLREMARVCKAGGRVVVADIVAAEDPPRRNLHNQIERLRDPSHVAFLSKRQLRELLEGAGLAWARTADWSTPRGLKEWTAITGFRPEVLPELEHLMRRAIPDDAAGIQAGLGPDGEPRFTHHWTVAVAERR